MEKALAFINNLMERLSIPYEYYEWTEPLKLPISVGECFERPTYMEDGRKEFDFLITLWGEKLSQLYEFAEKIEEEIGRDGKHYLFDSANFTAWYDSAHTIPTAPDGIKRLEIEMRLIEWRKK